MAWTNMGTEAASAFMEAADWNYIVGNMDELQTWTSFTPTLGAVTTNPTLSDDASHTAIARYWKAGLEGTEAAGAGGICFMWITFIFGTSGVNAGSGTYQVIDLPVDIDAYPGTTDYRNTVIGGGFIQDAGTAREPVIAYRQSSTSCRLYRTGATTGSVTSSAPWTWANSDQIKLFLMYPILSTP